MSITFDPDSYDYPDPDENPPDLDEYYGTLVGFVEMITGGYDDLFMLDAPGGLGKTYNVKRVLRRELSTSQWTHERGFTTPLELYKTLWKAQEHDNVLFLDDMSGLKSSQKARDMLKAATETDGVENWVSYKTSQDIEHPYSSTRTLPQRFCFRGSIIISFNETPDNADFNALRDRGIDYRFDLDYDERLGLIREAAKLPNFHNGLDVSEQQQVAEWIATVTDASMDVTLRTLEKVCNMRHFGQMEDQSWEKMAFDVFGADYEQYLIIRLREDTDLPIEEQIELFKEETGKSRSHYYTLLNQIKDERA
jgi:hypothetical protein